MKTRLLFSLLIVTGIFITSCGGDDGPDGVDCNDSVSLSQLVLDEVEVLGIALSNFSTDPSPSNCDSLKSAYSVYINALKGLQGCANDAGVGQEFSQTIEDVETDIDNLTC